MRRKLLGFVIILLIGTVTPVYGSLGDLETSLDASLISPGTHLEFMSFNGEIRSYRIHIPTGYDSSNPVPLVFNFHGTPGGALTQMLCTEFNGKADEEEFVVVYPNGHFDPQFLSYWIKTFGVIYLFTGFRYFNAWDFENANVDDVGFIQALIEELNTTLHIDSSRIYATGLSCGGFMSYRLGAEFSDTFAAIAPVAGSIGGRLWIDYTIDTSTIPCYIIPEPEYPLPVIVFHGMKDEAVPYEGIEDKGYGLSYLSVNKSVAFWVEHNQCNPIPEIEVSESENIIRRTYKNGSQGSEVVLYTVVNGGHEWFGGEYVFPPCEISATDLIWDFFETHPKK